MEFCPECGAMMFPKDGVLKCNRCGYDPEKKVDNDDYTFSKEIINYESIKVSDNSSIPNIKYDTSMYKRRRFQH